MKKAIITGLACAFAWALFFTPAPSVVYTYARLEAASTFSALQTFTQGMTISGGTFARTNTKTIEVCPTGCQYATLAAACAANTSTSATPIRFLVGPGSYAAIDTVCSGQDHAAFIGSGIGVTTLQGIDHGFGIVAGKGGLNLGTSTNIEVAGFTLKGSRGLWWDGGGVGGGNSFIHDNEFTTTSTNGDEDGFFWRGFVSGSVIRIANNRITSFSDGLTIDNDGTTSVFSSNNQFNVPATITTQDAGWALRSIPCTFVSQNDTFTLTGSRTGASNLMAYHIDGNPGDGSSGCAAGTAQINIIGASIVISNTSSNGQGGQAQGVYMPASAAEVGNLNIIATHIKTSSSDTTTGISYGVFADTTAGVVTIIGGDIAASGGPASARRDLKLGTTGAGASNLIRTSGVVRGGTDDGTTAVVGGDVKYLLVSTQASFTGVTTFTVGVGSSNFPTITSNEDLATGLVLKNLNTGTQTSPRIIFQNGKASPDSYNIYEDSGGQFKLTNSANTLRFYLDQTGTFRIEGATGSDFWARSQSANLHLGNNVAGDNNICMQYDAGVDAFQCWNSSNTRLEYTGVTVFRHSTAASPPASCAIGDEYLDTSGGVCYCTTTGTPGTWTNVSAIGNCT